MKVVLATHRTNQRLGVNKYFYLLGKYLAKAGVDVNIIVDSAKGAIAVEEIAEGGVKIVILGPTALGAVSTIRYCHNLSSYLTTHPDFDILHCGHVLPFFYLVQLARSKRKPVVFQPFGNELFTLAGRGLNRYYCQAAQPMLRLCGERADILLIEGKFQEAEVLKYYPEVRAVSILPVGVDVDTIKPKDEYANGVFRFLAVNSLLPYEGMDELLKALRKMYLRKDTHLTIVGVGSQEKKLRVLAERLPVRFKQDLLEAELRRLYTTSDAFVCTSHETDFQMGVLEAMASGLPVLCRDADWLPDSVIRFRKDGSDLAARMLWMVSEPACNRRERAERGLKEVGQYSFTKIAEKALEIYSEILGGNCGQN